MQRLLPPSLAFVTLGFAVAAEPAALVPVPGEPVLEVPAGVTVQVAGDSKDRRLMSPTAITFDEAGALYVAETHRLREGRGVEDDRDRPYWYLDDLAARTTDDRRALHEKWKEKLPTEQLTALSEVVRRLEDTDGDGKFERSDVFADGFNDVLDGTAGGVFAMDGSVYFACIPKIWALRDTNGDGRADDKRALLDGFGVRVSFSGHDMGGLVLGPDGRLYGTIGDRGFHVTNREGEKSEFPGKGAVFRFEPDGSGFEVVHTGLRNPKELAFDDKGNAFTIDNNSDQGDKSRLVYIVEGGDSGWEMEHQTLHTFHRLIGLPVHPPNRWMEESMWQPRNSAQPANIVPPVANFTSGPSGLTFHPGTGFLAAEAGRFAICDYGGSSAGSGVWSFGVEPSGAGMKLSGSPRRLAWGVAASDVEYSWDGKLFVADFGGGWSSHPGGRVLSLDAGKTMWRETEAEEAARLAREGFEGRAAVELASLLKHPDQRVRLRAQLALTRRPEALDLFTKAAASSDATERLHGIWGLGVLARRGAALRPPGASGFSALPDATLRAKAAKALLPLFKHADAEVRAQAVKVLAEGPADKELQLGTLILDPSPRVRFFATIAAGKLRAYGEISTIWDMLAQNAGKDPYLSHAGAFALQRLTKKPQQLKVLSMHESPHVRLAAVVALRRMRAPEVADFLYDDDRRVADEAIRAIHDEAIEAVRPAVAALLDEEGVEKRTPFMLCRLVHSAFRCGGETNARRLVTVATAKKLPVEVRREALRLLALWPEPPPVDQSTGHWAPLPKRDAAEILPVLQEAMPALLKVEGSLLAGVFGLAERFQLPLDKLDAAGLKSLIAQSSIPGNARAKALRVLADRNPPDLLPSLVRFATDKDPAVAVEALRLLLDRFSKDAVKPLMTAANSSNPSLAQAAWRALGTVRDPAVSPLFERKLKELRAKNGVSPVAIELLEAARKRSEPEVKQALADYDAAVSASGDSLAKWLPSLEGGDANRGAALFQSHPASECMRCHRAEREGDHGGEVGPNLAGVALRGDRRFLLESLVLPSAKISPGYGVLSVTLKNDAVLGGMLLEETDAHVDLNASGKHWRVKRSDIKSLTPAFSAMPPMEHSLTPAELRDLVAWLATKREEVPVAKPSATPPVLDPETLRK